MFNNMTAMDFLIKGGPVFLFIIIVSIISIATILERLIAFLKINRYFKIICYF